MTGEQLENDIIKGKDSQCERKQAGKLNKQFKRLLMVKTVTYFYQYYI